MKAKVRTGAGALLAAVALAVSVPVLSGSGPAPPSPSPPPAPTARPEPPSRHEFMRQKLDYSKLLLEGLAVENYDLITRNARALRRLSTAAQWEVPTIPNATDYVGWYPLAPSFGIRIAERKGAVYFQATGRPGLWLKPLSVDRFVLAGVPAEVFFQRDDRGQVESLTWRQHGQEYQGVRVAPPAPPNEVGLSQATLAEYVGQYLLKQGFVITIRLMDAGLVAQATEQDEASIFPSAKDEFFCKAVEARIDFIRNPAGEIIGLILNQDGRTILGERIR